MSEEKVRKNMTFPGSTWDLLLSCEKKYEKGKLMKYSGIDVKYLDSPVFRQNLTCAKSNIMCVRVLGEGGDAGGGTPPGKWLPYVNDISRLFNFARLFTMMTRKNYAITLPKRAICLVSARL